MTFVKHITSQRLTKEGLNKLGDTVMRLAEVRGWKLIGMLSVLELKILEIKSKIIYFLVLQSIKACRMDTDLANHFFSFTFVLRGFLQL